MADMFDIEMGEAMDFSPVPDGAYEAVCEEKPEPGESDAGNPVLVWKFRLVGSNGQEEYSGKEIVRKTPTTGKGAGFTRDTLKGLSVPFTLIDESTPQERIRFDRDLCLGKHCILTISKSSFIRKKDGKKGEGNQVDNISPIES